jgi:hypothetical protein
MKTMMVNALGGVYMERVRCKYLYQVVLSFKGLEFGSVVSREVSGA